MEGAHMDVCPEHGRGCTWFIGQNPDRVGADLDFVKGITSGLGFARAHRPMRSHRFPISDGRIDAYATGFMRGCWSTWCPLHAVSCPGTPKCRDAVLARLPET